MVGSDGESRLTDKPKATGVFALALVAAVIVAIEIGRRKGFSVPVPFLSLFGSVVLAAGLSGVRVGMAAATMAAAFICYSAVQHFGPASLTGSAGKVLGGSAVVFLTAYLLGRTRDRMLRLNAALIASQNELMNARKRLEERLEHGSGQIKAMHSELSNIRSSMDVALEQSPVGMLIIDADRQLASVNRAALGLMGVREIPDSWKDFRTLLGNYRLVTSSGDVIDFDKGPLNDALEHGKPTDRLEYQAERPDGEKIWVRSALAPIEESNGSIAGAVVISVDITENRRTTEMLQNLSKSLVQVQEDERTRLARELHDEVSQQLAALHMNLHAMKRSVKERAELADCLLQVNALASTVKDLSTELRPAVLDDLGLVAALRWYLARQRRRTGHGITFDANIDLGQLPLAVTTASFRVVQEAVSNAIEHSNCNALTVRLYNERGYLCIDTYDDGCGFDTAIHALGQAPNGGLGIVLMRTRVDQLNGKFAVESEIGKGTTVTACFPLD